MIKFEILKPIDNLIESQLDNLQEKPEVQNILDSYAGLDDHIQKIIKVTISAVLIIAPVLFYLVLSSMNSNLQTTLSQKENLLEMAQRIIKQQSDINGIKDIYTGKTFVESESQMSDLLSVNLGSAGVSSSNIKVNNFSLMDSASITEVRFELNFSELSNTQFFAMIKSLSSNTRMKFSDISIQKNKTSNLLNGVITTHYYSEIQEQEDF